MSQSRISIVAAMDEKRGIGKNRKIPWHIPQDLKHFKQITTGHPVIMGRKTFESIGRPLPNRTNIIVTHNTKYLIPDTKDVIIVSSLEEALRQAQGKQGSDEVFVIGGGQIYAQAIDMADKLYLTIVQGEYDADTFSPEYENRGFKIVKEEKGEDNGYTFRFVDLER